jgi:hypothetical protein
MTRIFEIESEEFSRIEEGKQSFISLKDDKAGIKGGDTIIFQDVPEEEGAGVREVTMKVGFTCYEGLKQGWVTCSLNGMYISN